MNSRISAVSINSRVSVVRSRKSTASNLSETPLSVRSSGSSYTLGQKASETPRGTTFTNYSVDSRDTRTTSASLMLPNQSTPRDAYSSSTTGPRNFLVPYDATKSASDQVSEGAWESETFQFGSEIPLVGKSEGSSCNLPDKMMFEVSPYASRSLNRWRKLRITLPANPFSFERIVDSTTFNVIIMTSIIANAIFMFVEEEYRDCDTCDGRHNEIFDFSEVCFNVIFMVECALKIMAWKRQYFTSSWNLLDFTLVFTGIIGIVLNYATTGDEASSNTSILRIARVFRVLRLI